MTEERNLYRCAGELGLPVGGYLFAIALCMIYMPRLEWLSLVGLLLMAGFPFVVWRCQRQYARLSCFKVEFAELWMLGIVTIMCGAAVSALGSWLVVRYLEPNFMADMLSKTITAYSQASPAGGDETLKEFKKIQESGYLPSAIDIAMSMFWITAFTGSLLSAITALIAKQPPRHKQ